MTAGHALPRAQEDKERREREAMTAMCSSLGTAAGAQLLELWEEYEAGVSPEAMLLKDLDKLEMILQAYECAPALSAPCSFRHTPPLVQVLASELDTRWLRRYEKAQRMSLEEFFTSTAGKFKTATGQAWAAEVVRRRMQVAAAPDCAPGTLPEGGKTSAAQP
jgi:putative hydrolase of HD superfamily